MRRLIAAFVAVACLTLWGCTPGGAPNPDPMNPVPAGVPDAAPALAVVAKAISTKDVTAVPMVGDAADAQAEYDTVFAGMDGLVPTATPGALSYDDDTATGALTLSIPVAKKPWTYETTATFTLVDDQWRLDWSPTVLNPDVTADSRLRRTVTPTPRGAINDNQGLALVEEGSLFQIGIDKSRVDPADWAASAAALAALVEVDVAAFQKKVADGGEKQFVVATTVPQDRISPRVGEIPGGHVHEVPAMIAPSDTFAIGLLGTVGNPTAEMIEKSEGTLMPEDVVGLSGLQSRYDAKLGGTPGVFVTLVERADRVSEEEFTEQVLFQQDVVAATSIDTSLDRELQAKAESVLAGQEGIAALVVIDLATGGLAAAAVSPAAGSYPHATFGKYAPGSTFKVASALAMLRAGMSPETTVECPSSLEVGGHTFGNYSGYPSDFLGEITLTDALAHSCNTTFAGAAAGITGEQLHAAAGSLGVGTDYDAGFRTYFGTVDPGNDIDRAASMIGQGTVTMSPMGMAAVAASVASGKTVIPWLVKDVQAASTAAPLTPEEAASLRTMMTATVDSGSAQSLQGIMTGAKTGTAEFGVAPDYRTHAWMIAYNDAYAVASFVEVGDSGGTTAAPLIRRLFE